MRYANLLTLLAPIALISLNPGAVVAQETSDAPADPYYGTVSAWNADERGPLPRWRLGPSGENATPAPAHDQRKTPYAISVAQSDFAPDACTIASPPEYAPVDGVLFEYPGGWPDLVSELVAELTDAAHDEIAYVVVANASTQNQAENDFVAAGADLSKVDFILAPNDSIWMRDYGPHFITQGGSDAIVDSIYYPTRPLDNYVPTLAGDDHFVIPTYDIPLYYSGGNFQASTDRQGFVTALVRSDNPGLSDQTIADLYDRYQGVDTLHFFPQLPSGVDGTGHIDMWFYLVDEDTVIIAEFLPGENADAIQITNDAVPYMESLGYEVFRVPAWNGPNPGGSAHYTYTNAFRVNDRIFIPKYGDGNANYLQRDADALAAWQAAAGPGVEIVPIDCYGIIWAAGAIHCIVKQVPRYPDTVPAACTTSPGGGELLVPGSQHEITWTADDDGDITSVDLYYSVDGGATYPPSQIIATGLDDDGRHPWTVPLVETAAARVRVVAHDDQGNSVEAESEFDVAFESALRTVYDFGSGAGVDRRMYGHATSGWNVLDGTRRPTGVASELSASDYAAIAASDATGGDGDPNRFIAPVPGFFNESTHIVEIDVAEDPAEIIDIEVLWEGYADGCNQMELYVWDHVAAQWCDGAGNCGANAFLDNIAVNRDDVLRAHIRSDFARYLDGSGTITFLVYGEEYNILSNQVFHDYFAVTVTHDPCAGADLDFDGWADACDNCVATVNIGQTNSDTDARGDLCDCAINDGTAFAIPSEIDGLAWSVDTSSLSWTSDAANSGSGIEYDVLRGALGDFPVGGGAQEACEGSGLTGTSLGGLPTPAAGTGDYYLVRGANACGAGTYGFDSDGLERTSGVCP